MNKKTLKERLQDLINSPRFIMITATAIAQIIDMVVIPGTLLSGILDVIKVYLLTVAGIGTVDKISENIGSKNKA